MAAAVVALWRSWRWTTSRLFHAITTTTTTTLVLSLAWLIETASSKSKLRWTRLELAPSRLSSRAEIDRRISVRVLVLMWIRVRVEEETSLLSIVGAHSGKQVSRLKWKVGKVFQRFWDGKVEEQMLHVFHESFSNYEMVFFFFFSLLLLLLLLHTG